jgi:hypothetical protein
MYAETTGEAVAIAADAPTATAPAFTPWAVAADFGAAEAVTDTLPAAPE